jgi:hypothetical protein
VYLGFFNDTTDGNGTSSTALTGMPVDLPLPSNVMSGWYVTMTVTEVDMTDPMNPIRNTSQFSQCFVVPAAPSGNPVVGVLPVPVQPVAPLPQSGVQPVNLVPFAQAGVDLFFSSLGQPATHEQPGGGIALAHHQHLNGHHLAAFLQQLDQGADVIGNL